MVSRLFAVPALLLVALAPAAPRAADIPLRRHLDRVPSLDPIQATSVSAARAVALVYETLLEYDYAARPYRLRGGLAIDLPEVSDDGRTLTFTLRNDVRFGPDACFGSAADGSPSSRALTAEDVVYSFKRLADAKLSSPAYWVLENRIEGLDAFREASRAEGPTDYALPVAGLQALDPRRVRLTLTAPSPQLLWALAIPSTSIVPREAVESYGATRFGQTEVGSGAFRLVSWRRNYRMEFERRPGRDASRDATPVLDEARGAWPVERIRFVVMDDPTTRWLAFLMGQLDIEGDIPRDNWDSVVGPDGTLAANLTQRGIRMLAQPSLDCFYVGFNLDDPTVGPNRKLRQALNCAFDYAQWAALNPGRVDPATGPVPPKVAGRLETPFAYGFDLERAGTLLAEAGYPEGQDPATGRRLTLRIELGRTDQETRASTELLAAFFERIGVVLEANYNNWPAFLQKVGRREAQLFRVGWLADYPDAENFLQLFHSRNVSPGPNRSNYVNPAFDALYDEAMRTPDEARRLDLYARMQDIIREDCPWIFLYHRRDVVLLHPRVRNYRMHDFPYGMEKHLFLTD